MWFIAFALSIAHAQNIDIRQLAPARPSPKAPTVAIPESGQTLEDVGGDWARRQLHLSLDGADERWLHDANLALDRFFGRNQKLRESETEFRSPASQAEPQASAFLPQIRLPSLGTFELGFASNLKIRCDLVNGNELTLVRPIFQDIDLRLQHQNTMNSVRLNLNW